MKCPKCGTELVNGVSFCKECGAKVKMVPKFCKECGAELMDDSKFCSSCGASISLPQTKDNTKTVTASTAKDVFSKIPLQELNTPDTATKPKTGNKLILFATVGAIAIFLIAIIGISSGSQKEKTSLKASESNAPSAEISVDLNSELVGTYIGENESILTFLSDGTADYYYKPYAKEPLTGQKWSISNSKITWQYKGKIEVYATIKNNDVSELYFQCLNPLQWENEHYTKVSTEAKHWTMAECDDILSGTESTTTEVANNDSATTIASEAISEAIPSKDPWDLTGSWCEKSVENGSSGMAAFFTETEMIVYNVSENAGIRSPFWIGTYETNEGQDSFSWTSQLEQEKRKDCALYSSDNEKDFKYHDGIISFSTSVGDKELSRTDLDFSDDYHNISSKATVSQLEIGGMNLSIPSSFGLYIREKDTDDNSESVRYISDDALLVIRYSTNENYDTTKISDKEYKSYYNEATKSIISGLVKDISNSNKRDDTDIQRDIGLAHSCAVDGTTKQGVIGTTYLGTIGIKETNCFLLLTMIVPETASHDYANDFKYIFDYAKVDKTTARTVAFSNLTAEEDKVSQVTFYKPKNYPKYTNERTFVLPYLATKGDTCVLHLKANYYGKDWVFWDKLVIAIDDERYEMEPGLFETTNTDVDGRAKVVETFDFSSLSSSDVNILRKIVTSKETIIRFKGDSKKYDHTVSDEDKQAIRDILTAYDNWK